MLFVHLSQWKCNKISGRHWVFAGSAISVAKESACSSCFDATSGGSNPKGEVFYRPLKNRAWDFYPLMEAATPFDISKRVFRLSL